MRLFLLAVLTFFTSGTLIPVFIDRRSLAVTLTVHIHNGNMVRQMEQIFYIYTNSAENIYIDRNMNNSHGLIAIGESRLAALPSDRSFRAVLTIRPEERFGTHILLAGKFLVSGLEIFENFCQNGTLIYVQSGTTHYRLLAKAFVDNHSIEHIDRGYYSIDPNKEFDYLPHRIIHELLNVLIPSRLSDDLPEFLSDCDLVNGQYPIIQFLIGDDIGSEFVPRGNIIYYPDDYLKPAENGRCRFMIRGSYQYHFGLNFISKFSFHFNGSTLGICDPIEVF